MFGVSRTSSRTSPRQSRDVGEDVREDVGEDLRDTLVKMLVEMLVKMLVIRLCDMFVIRMLTLAGWRWLAGPFPPALPSLFFFVCVQRSKVHEL